MKIAIIHRRYKYKGGLETRLFSYINYFLQNGDTVDLFVAEIDTEIQTPTGLTIHYINVKHYFKHFRNYFFNKKLEQTFKESNYDFALALERNSVLKHLIAANTHKGSIKAENQIFLSPIDYTIFHLEKKSFANAQVIYACSNMVKNELETLYNISANKIKILYPPINIKNFENNISATEARQKLGYNSEDKLFLFVSTSHKRKGLPLLKKVFANLPRHYKLLVAGTPFKSTKNIISLGFVKDMSVLYQAVDCLLHPALYEPFGQIVVEAISQNVPVLVSKKVGAAEFVNENNGLILSVNNIQEWQSEIENFDKKKYKFNNNNEILEELSLKNHMKLMMQYKIQ